MNRIFRINPIKVFRSVFDSNAQAFITAAGITNSQEQNAINQLVLNLKLYGLWTKMKAVYPFVGGTATTQKFNLIDPQDTDAAYRLQFNGAWTHSLTGGTPTSGTGWANTFYITGIHGLQDSCHISYYVRNHVAGQYTEMGINGSLAALNIAYNWNNTSYPANNNLQNTLSGSSIPSYWINSRTNSSNYGWFRNTTKTTITQASTTPDSTFSIALGGFNPNSGPSYRGSGRECAFSTIGEGLSDLEVSNLYNTVQAFQTLLGRQV